MNRREADVIGNNLILVVDDEREIRGLLTRFLTRKGFEVISAGTIDEGRALLRLNHPFLVFLDVNLPDGNGLNELKVLNSKNKSYKIIMMSAFDHQEARAEALESGALDFLSKPFNIAQLNEIVQNEFKS